MRVSGVAQGAMDGGNDPARTPARFGRLAWGAVASALLLGACNVLDIAGEGPVQSEVRQVAIFSRVSVDNGIGLTFQIGPTQPLEVRAQANILPLIATDVSGDTLRIRATKGYRASERATVTIVTPTLEEISLSGGSPAQVDGLDAERLIVRLSGGSHLTATGSADALDVGSSGGSRADLGDLSTLTVVLEVSGGSNATVRASEHIAGSASGGSRVTVLGGGQVEVEATGGAVVAPG